MNTQTLTTHLHHVIESRLIRYGAAILWATLATIALLQSSTQPVLGPPAPAEPPDLFREIVLTSLHVLTFMIFSALWWWAFVATLPSRRAVILTAIIAISLGTITEYAQIYVPDRSATLTDLAANYIAVLMTLWWLYHYGNQYFDVS